MENSMSKDKSENELRDRLLSDQNIFHAIYYVDSYIQNKELLSEEDLKLLDEIHDVFFDQSSTIRKVKAIINKLVNDEDYYLNIDVYFKPKKYEDKNKNIVFRPLHTANLLSQIAMVSMLQILIYDLKEDKKLIPSNMSRLIPDNFYGNRVDYSGNGIFKPWSKQYQEYIKCSNDCMYNCSKSKKYKYEVNLDLVNFFPSINPITLVNYLCSLLPKNSTPNDIELYKIVIKKLCFFKLGDLNEIEKIWYHSSNEVTDITFAKGIPQGLPHSYFFANLFMILVKEKYNSVFPGEMFFYVDDSVIFTNGNKGFINDETFSTDIEKLNNSFKEIDKKYKSNDLIIPKKYNYKDCDYEIRVHDMEGKSNFYDIDKAIKESGELYLHSLSRETSNLSFDLFTNISDDNLKSLERRTKAIVDVIDKEITESDNSDNRSESYVKKLVRYKKYFKYRAKILEYRNENNIERLFDSFNNLFNEIFNDVNQNIQRENFIDKFNDDILSSLLGLLLENSHNENKIEKELFERINKLIALIYDKNTSHSYLKKAYIDYYILKKNYIVTDKYNTLSKKVILALHTKSNLSKEKKFLTVKKIFGQRRNVSIKRLYRLLGIEYIGKYDGIVVKNNNEIIRMILNAIYSYVFGYIIDDSISLSKRIHSEISYSELRTLANLRNKSFNTEDFILNYKNYSLDEYNQTIDYSLLQVMPYFIKYVKDIKRIDNLILIHKYCCDTWKNGSKYLYFYTLHNQEHAVSLIKSSVQIIHKISYFKIKSFDYYILFSACYLHDISMVSFPNLEKFYIGNNQKADKIYTDFIKNLDVANSSETKKTLCNTFQEIELFFENDIRSNHAYNSAMEIRKFKELDFISKSDRELIARISNSHGSDSNVIYGAKSAGTTELINEKMLKILLRLSDLLDISRYRISKLILNHNLENINDTSRFHWLSHLITDGCQLETYYNESSNDKTFLSNHSITEKVILTVDVFLSQTTADRKKYKCKKIETATLDKKSNLKYILDCDKICDRPECNYLCKWFSIKNNYLFDELASLKYYLNAIVENYYQFDIEILVHPIEKTNITNKEFDYLTEYMNNY